MASTGGEKSSSVAAEWDSQLLDCHVDLKSIFTTALESTKDRVSEMKLELCRQFDQERVELNTVIEQLQGRLDDAEGKIKKFELDQTGNKDTMDRIRDQL